MRQTVIPRWAAVVHITSIGVKLPYYVKTKREAKVKAQQIKAASPLTQVTVELMALVS